MRILTSPSTRAQTEDTPSEPAGTRAFGVVIQARRRERGWSQERLAREVAAQGDRTIRQSDISRMERNQVQLPRTARLQHLAAALDLTTLQLLALAGWGGAAAAVAEVASLQVAAEPPLAADALAGAPCEVQIDIKTIILDRLAPWPIEIPELSTEAMALEETRIRLRAALTRARETRAESQNLLTLSSARRGNGA